MAVVFMKSPSGDLLTLDAITEVSKSRSNSLTKSSVMSGAQISDGYTIGNPTITFSGICSYTKVGVGRHPAVPPTPVELNTILDEMVISEERFTLYGNDLIPTLNNVVIKDYGIVQSKWLNTINVTITVEQVFVSESATRTRITRPAADTNGDVTEEQDGGQGTKTQIKEEDKETLLATTLKDIFN